MGGTYANTVDTSTHLRWNQIDQKRSLAYSFADLFSFPMVM
jgi:hypothetical protein